MTHNDPRRVFSSRVDNYIKCRPGYPREVIDILARECGLAPNWRVADIGSGTGLLTRLFLDLGCTVTGVEPNDEMRFAGEGILAGYSNFTSLPGSAESTGLADASIDLITAGMALQWFDLPRARVEFRRVLAPGGWVALVWNRMLTGPDPFMQAFTSLILAYSPGWTETLRRDGPGSSLDLPGFFGGSYQRTTFPMQQSLDWEGLCGRILSTAHAPQADDPASVPMFTRLREIFDRFENEGRVTIDYETELYYGHLS
jgi:SAM-dependent methyltransferase